MVWDFASSLAISVLWLSTFIFVAFYYRRLRTVSDEYLKARSLVENIVLTFKNRYDELSSGLKQLKMEISVTQSTAQEMTGVTSKLSRHVQESLGTLEEIKVASDGLFSNIQSLQEEVKQLKNVQETLQAKINLSSLPKSSVENQQSAPKMDDPATITSQLTETENVVLQFLLSEGPRTARDVEAKIGKTREHTARLMKKLWQEGYVERETHKIPFTYRAAEALRNLENTST